MAARMVEVKKAYPIGARLPKLETLSRDEKLRNISKVTTIKGYGEYENGIYVKIECKHCGSLIDRIGEVKINVETLIGAGVTAETIKQ